MQQLTQQLKSGKMEILEVPFPALNKGQILVRNHYSVISAGTEGRTVTDARKGYIAKAKSRQKEVKQVLDMIKTSGLLPTYKVVMNKLEAPSPLGYSCAGEVIAVGEGVNNFKVGDRVACGGQGAFHADVVSVYKNLCVKIPKNINIKHAAFSTIASIAIQGIRQADLRFGENCVVIGLGLIGQLTIQILNAAGIKTIGIDIKDQQVELAEANGADLALNRNQNNLEKVIEDFTDGYGADAVIIAAASSSTDPVNLAGSLCRKKGKIIVVGRFPTNFDRTHYYLKELDLRMSTSYGPGRYDSEYEEKGIDYPIGYVRWTENRNMQAFIDLLAKGKIDLTKLLTHEYNLFEAPEAYDMILKKTESFTGILIKYNIDKVLKKEVIVTSRKYSPEEVNVGFIGAGSFAQNTLLPHAKGLCNFIGVATARGSSAKYVADKYNFNYCSDNAEKIICDEKINTLFIATRHNLHSEFVLKGIMKNKNVFVEKPISINLEDLEKIKNVYETLNNPPRLLVGYNRRFSPHIVELKKRYLDNVPKSINCRINAGIAPKDHWAHDPEIGGGRIIGEVCHFVDLAMFISGSKITSVAANVLNNSQNLMDTLSVNLTFENGSIASISYFSNGNTKVRKEYLEVFCNGEIAIVDDFKKMKIYNEKVTKYNLKNQDKGHSEEIKQFFHSITQGKPSPINFDDIYLSTLATLKIVESIQQRRIIAL
jgi:polar amino acid transport system substrate-binding protein